jgi:ABC-2 type transport system ATP-binding protein
MEQQGPAVIKVSGLRKTYKGSAKPAVDGLSFTVAEGDVFGLLGPNGAGKSTTIMALCGLLKIDAGGIEAFGLSVKEKGGEIRKRLGVAPQDIALFPSLTLKENLEYFGRMYGLDGAAIRSVTARYTEAFGLADKADVRVAHFSGGMKRRLNLIAALLHSPRLLILDEPTTGVDVQSRRIILDSLLELNSQGVTIIYSSHLLEEAEKICSRVAILDEGRMVAEGTIAGMRAAGGECWDLEQYFLDLTGREAAE